MAKRILVIDDEPSVREVFAQVLTEAGYTVETAMNGAQGLEMAEAQPPDLIFLDLRMPGMDGIEVLRRLRAASSGCAEVPVCIVTAFHKQFFEPLRRAAEEGLRFDLADKPLTTDQIEAIARGKLEGAATV